MRNTLLSVLLRSSCLGSKVMCVKDLAQAAFVLISQGQINRRKDCTLLLITRII